ncbi:MAG TPA: cytochrome c [Chryseosolibacter sp.]
MKRASMILSFTAGVFIAAIFLSFSPPQDKPWVVPESAKKMKNPTKSSPDNLEIGKNLYSKHCKSCHGKNGEGDGPKAPELKTTPGDFTSEEFKAQSDGELFFKTTEGRDDMPSFKKKIGSDEDRWLVINYIKTLKP